MRQAPRPWPVFFTLPRQLSLLEGRCLLVLLKESVPALRGPGVRANASDGLQLPPHLKNESVLATPGRPGVRVIAKRFGVDPGTVQRIGRPFAGAIVVVVG